MTGSKINIERWLKKACGFVENGGTFFIKAFLEYRTLINVVFQTKSTTKSKQKHLSAMFLINLILFYIFISLEPKLMES